MHKFLGQAQARPKAKRAHLAAAHERKTQPISKETHHRSEATPSRRIRRVHDDLRAHQSYQTDLAVMTHGPHRLSDDTWRGVVGPQWRFGSFLGQEVGGSLLYI